MELKEARKNTVSFLKQEFDLWNLETFLTRNLIEGYALFKERFMNRYGQQLSKRFDAKTLKNLGGRIKDIFLTDQLDHLYTCLDQCAEVFTYDFKLKPDWPKNDLIMKYAATASHLYSFAEELKVFSEEKSQLEKKVTPESPETQLYHLLGSCLNNGHDKVKLDEANRLCRQVFYGKNKIIDSPALRLAYRYLISDLFTGKDGEERYHKITELRLSYSLASPPTL